MIQKITLSTVRKMRIELDKLEVQAQQEMKVRKTRPLGHLRMGLVNQSRRHLLYLAVAMKQARNADTRR